MPKLRGLVGAVLQFFVYGVAANWVAECVRPGDVVHAVLPMNFDIDIAGFLGAGLGLVGGTITARVFAARARGQKKAEEARKWTPETALWARLNHYAQVATQTGRPVYARLEIVNFSPFAWTISAIKAYSLGAGKEQHLIAPFSLDGTINLPPAPATAYIEVTVQGPHEQLVRNAVRNCKDGALVGLNEVTSRAERSDGATFTWKMHGNFSVVAEVKERAP